MPLKATPSIAREVVQLAAPIIGRSLLETLVFLVDRAMLGHYTADALASMQISGPMIWSISSIFSAFAVGAIALVGHAVGSGDRALASATARSSLLLAFVVGIVLAILSLVMIRSAVLVVVFLQGRWRKVVVQSLPDKIFPPPTNRSYSE